MHIQFGFEFKPPSTFFLCHLNPVLIPLPETVTPFNIERLQKLVDNGPHPPPGETGAKYIIREDGRRINLMYMRAAADRRLEIRDKVIYVIQQPVKPYALALNVSFTS